MSSYVSNETLNVQIPHSTVVPIKFWIHYLWSPTLYLPRLRYSIQHTALVPHFLEALIFLNHQAHYSRCHWWFMTLMVRSIHFTRRRWVVFFSKISHKCALKIWLCTIFLSACNCQLELSLILYASPTRWLLRSILQSSKAR